MYDEIEDFSHPTGVFPTLTLEYILTYIATAIHIGEVQCLCVLERSGQCLQLCVAIRAYSYHAPTIGDYLSVLESRTRMEEIAALHLVESSDRVTLLVVARVTSRDEHHAHGTARVKLDSAFAQVALGHPFKEVYDVTLQSQHHTLGLRITHTHVVFYNHRIAFHVDKAKEDEPLIVDALGSQTLYGRLHDTLLYLLHPVFIGKGHRRYRAHSTCIQPCITLANTFVVLGFGQ